MRAPVEFDKPVMESQPIEAVMVERWPGTADSCPIAVHVFSGRAWLNPDGARALAAALIAAADWQPPLEWPNGTVLRDAHGNDVTYIAPHPNGGGRHVTITAGVIGSTPESLLRDMTVISKPQE